MATGITRNITEDVTFTSKYEMTAYDDILNIIGATVTLAKPAGDIFTNEGNDTVTITDSTITASALGLSFMLGSGNDTLYIQNSTMDAPTLAGSGNDIVVITGDKQSQVNLAKQDDEEYTLNLGANDDVLELRAILSGDGDVTFGTGKDTLRFNGGSLLTTGKFGTFSILDIMTAGGILGRDLTLAGENTLLKFNGAFFGTAAGKVINISDSTTTLTTADNIRTDVTWNLSNVTLTQSDSGTLEFSGHSGYAVTANNSTVTLHDIVTQAGQVFTGNNTIWKISDSDFANSTNGIDLTGGTIDLDNVGMSDYTKTAMKLNGTKLTGAQLAFTSCQGKGALSINNADAEINDLRMNGNVATAFNRRAYATAYATAIDSASASTTSDIVIVSSSAVGGAICHTSGNLTLTNANFSGNIASASAYSSCADAVAYIAVDSSGKISAYATAAIAANANGGAIYHTAGNLTLTSANFSGNIASASAYSSSVAAVAYAAPFDSSGKISAYATAAIAANANGGAIYHTAGNLTLTSANFSGNIASASAYSSAVYAYASSSGTGYATATATAAFAANANGGAIYHTSGNLTLPSAIFSGNIAAAVSIANNVDSSVRRRWGSRAYATVAIVANAKGGAIYHTSGNLTLTSAVFSRNMAIASAPVDAYASGSAAGGALFANNSILNVENTDFHDNNAMAQIRWEKGQSYGGAMYLSASTMTYTVTSGTKLRNTGNQAQYGGFLYMTDNSTANLVVEDKAILTIGDSTNNDSIGGTGLIQKQGTGYLLINSDVSGYTGLWTVYEGTVELARISRTIKLDNWTFGENVLVILSSQDDTVNMTANKKISTLDLGGGSDVINTNGYSLSNGTLKVSKLKFTGGGVISSTITNREPASGFDLTLDDVVLNSNITGGDAVDMIAITKDSTLGGKIDLGNGANIITATGTTSFLDTLNTGKEDDTLTFADVVFSKAVTLGDGTNSLSASKATFKNTLTTGDGDDTLTITDASFSGEVALGAGDDTLTLGQSSNNSGNVTATKTIDLGDGDNSITTYGTAEFAGLAGGSGSDTIDLYKESTISGELDLGGGKNVVYVEDSLTMTDGAVKMTEDGETRIIVYRGTTLTDNTLTVYSDESAARDTVTMSWANQTDLDKVRLVVSSDHTFETFEFAVELYNKSKSFTLNLEKGYFVQFQANDEDGWKQRLLDDTIAPDQVTGVEFNGRTLTWDVTHDNLGGNGVKQYTVEVATDSGFTDVIDTHTVTETEYVPQGLGDGTYYFRVCAEDYTQNTGGWSTTVSGQLDQTPPTRPTGGQSSVNGYNVTLSWNAATDTGSGVAEYEYRIASDSSYSTIIRNDTTATLTVTENDLAYGTYYWQVRAIDNAGNVGEWSLSKTVKTQDLIAPGTPGNVDYGVEEKAVTVLWDAASDDALGSGLKEYIVQLSQNSEFSSIAKTVTVTDTTAAVSGLSGGDWYLRVCSVDNVGNQSIWSDTLSFTIEGPEPKPEITAKSDLDGNGVSDVMFQYTGGDYQIGFWMNGSSTWQGTGASQPDNWELLGNYDMDANGKADQVMFGNVLGGAYIGYYKDGDTTSNGWQNIGYLSNPDGIEWHNVVGNLTGNAGKNSIVWQAPELNACGVWTDGTTNWVGISGSFDANWEMQGCGDFTGDGKDEILWQYNGALYTTDINSSFASLGGWGNEWEVRAIGDFSNDGKDDIVVFHKDTGSVVKFADGLAENWSSLGQLDSTDWFIVGAGDYNNDQKDDLLVRQYSTGMLGYYSAGDMSQWNEMGRGVDMNWTVIA